MKLADIKTGELYACKVSGKIVPVRVEGVVFEQPRKFRCTNLYTDRVIGVRFKRLRNPLTKANADAMMERLHANCYTI